MGNGSGAGSALGRTLAKRRGRSEAPIAGAPAPKDDLALIGLAPDHPCFNCAGCCKYIAIEIDEPTTMQEYDYLIWYLVHPGVTVFVDWENGWFVKFDTRCQHLQPNGMCGIYETRPAICRDFDWKDCEQHLVDEPADKWLFRNSEEFVTWFQKQRPKTYQKFLAFQKQQNRKKTPKELRRLKIAELPPPPL
jgi:Fe-S-cluster containining protein